MGLDVLHDNNRSVFYPLQTLLKTRPVDFKTIPICLESENPTDFRLLDKVAKVISDKKSILRLILNKALACKAVSK
jgi:hypothetical protein